MSTLARHLDEYLRLRRALGHHLADAARLLPRFVGHLDATGQPTITVTAALAWVTEPESDPSTSVWMRRMTAVRGFARYMSGIDPATEIPPLGLVSFRQRWRQPFIYTDADIVALMDQVPRVIPTPLRAATFQTMIGLLAATGMRIGEAIALERGDIKWSEGAITIGAAKFNKRRELVVDPTTVDALSAYATLRDQFVADPPSASFFINRKGTPVIYASFGEKFREIVASSGVGAGSAVRPRVHDVRHSFAVNTLVRWYREGNDVGVLLPRLSTYLGHLAPGHTYWYLSAAPELLGLAAARLEKRTRS